MVTTGIQNLPQPLARAQAAFRDPTARLAAVSRDRLARRVEHFASSVRFVLDEPNAARRLHDLTKDLRGVPRLSRLLPRVLGGAMALVGGDVGDIQIVDPATGSLRLVTQAGFGPEFCEYSAVVDDGHSACGRAARQGAQTAIADVRTDPGFAPHREIAAASGFRRVQSTPLARRRRLPGRHGLDALPPPAPPVRARPADDGALRRFRRRGGHPAPGPIVVARPGRPGSDLGPARSRSRPGGQRVGPVRAVGDGPDDRELRGRAFGEQP